MSWQASAWVQEYAPVENQGEGCVLYVLANYARADGTAAWPSQQTIAEGAWCSDRTVRRHLKALEERGVIYRGDQRLVAHFPRDQRPVVWNLNLSKRKAKKSAQEGPDNLSSRGKEKGPDNLSGRSGEVGGAGQDGSEGPDTGVLQTTLEPPVEPPHPPIVPQGGHAKDPDRFAEFYEVYPRRVGKIAAEKAWKKAIKDVDPQSIIDGAVRFSSWCEATGQETRFIAHPSTWINHGRWEDELEWPASPQQQSGNGLAAWGAPSTQGFGFSGDPFGNLRGPVIDHEETS